MSADEEDAAAIQSFLRYELTPVLHTSGKLTTTQTGNSFSCLANMMLDLTYQTYLPPLKSLFVFLYFFSIVLP